MCSPSLAVPRQNFQVSDQFWDAILNHMHLVASKGFGGALAAEASIGINQAHQGAFPRWIYYLLQMGNLFLGFLVSPLPGDEVPGLTDLLSQLFLAVVEGRPFLWTKLLQRLLSSAFLFDSLEPPSPREFALGADILRASSKLV